MNEEIKELTKEELIARIEKLEKIRFQNQMTSWDFDYDQKLARDIWSLKERLKEIEANE